MSEATNSTGVEKIEKLLTKEDVAKFLSVTTRTVGELMKRGVLPYFKLGRCVRFKLEDVKARLEERCRVVNSVRGRVRRA